jgi:hypothetical protein
MPARRRKDKVLLLRMSQHTSERSGLAEPTHIRAGPWRTEGQSAAVTTNRCNTLNSTRLRTQVTHSDPRRSVELRQILEA